MRHLLPALCALSCLTSCAAKPPKPAARAVVPPPPPALRLKADGPSVAYAVPDGWRAAPSKEEAAPVILTRPEEKDEAIGLILQETGFDDTIEGVVTQWAMMAASMLNSFHVTGMEEPKYASDEEASFMVSGMDDAEQPMILICRIRHVGANVADFWAILLLTGRSTDAKNLTDVGDKLIKSLRVHAQTPP